jgi:hypothetical protein
MPCDTQFKVYRKGSQQIASLSIATLSLPGALLP